MIVKVSVKQFNNSDHVCVATCISELKQKVITDHNVLTHRGRFVEPRVGNGKRDRVLGGGVAPFGGHGEIFQVKGKSNIKVQF